ncbi:MAG TPA: glycoside hydrolase family 15 protein [Pyrinomonadaceae bacterium]|nr:glycoside hydrolase family 15 protein [Pyrinomonadaceae bacterium]
MQLIKPYLTVNLFLLTLMAGLVWPQAAPKAPGMDAIWLTAGKQAIGTAVNLKSKVWFTVARGILTDVYYPDVATANIQSLEFIVFDAERNQLDFESDADSFVEPFSTNNYRYTRTADGKLINIKQVNAKKSATGQKLPSSLSFRIITRAKDSSWEIEKIFITDPQSDSVVFKLFFRPTSKSQQLFVNLDPSISNTGMHDDAQAGSKFLSAGDGKIFCSLAASGAAFADYVAGFSGENDGISQLKKFGKLTANYVEARNGNVAITAGIKFKADYEATFALGFGGTRRQAEVAAESSAGKNFLFLQRLYESEWRNYLSKLPKVKAPFQAQFRMAAMVLKALEDKTHRGANVASLSIPWGGGANANEDVGGGYHLVWARDLYHVFTAFLALGDRAAAERALDFLFNVQQQSDGSFPQNSWLDGRSAWGSLQMDEVSYPIIMAWQLKRFDRKTYFKHIKPAAEFILRAGPATKQERWEEKSGYSPSTIAAEIAALVTAADIAQKNGDSSAAKKILQTADNWERNIENWTATTNGPYGDGNYYVRISQNGRPDARERIELNNNAGTFIENEIVDAGFLELVRLGIRRADDPLILKSLIVVDQLLKVETPNGPAFYRYNHDGYGEMDDGRRWNWDGKYTGKGRLWTLLSGERGQYELALFNEKSWNKQSANLLLELGYGDKLSVFRKAESRLHHLMAFANDGLMIPEQVWDKPEIPSRPDKRFLPELAFGEGTGSATPLAWSMAQFIRLVRNISLGKNFDTPEIVYRRYAGKQAR